jgi:hypothetical protein
MRTPAVCLKSCLRDLDKYVSDCVPHCVDEFGQNEILCVAARTQKADSHLLKDALNLWTANRLLMKGWEDDRAAVVTDRESPYFQRKPAPRVVQNELDAMLEKYVWKLELQLLSNLQKAMKRGANRAEIFSTVLVLLATVERDMWRLMYWTRHKEEVRRRPSFWYLL